MRWSSETVAQTREYQRDQSSHGRCRHPPTSTRTTAPEPHRAPFAEPLTFHSIPASPLGGGLSVKKTNVAGPLIPFHHLPSHMRTRLGSHHGPTTEGSALQSGPGSVTETVVASPLGGGLSVKKTNVAGPLIPFHHLPSHMRTRLGHPHGPTTEGSALQPRHFQHRNLRA